MFPEEEEDEDEIEWPILGPPPPCDFCCGYYRVNSSSASNYDCDYLSMTGQQRWALYVRSKQCRISRGVECSIGGSDVPERASDVATDGEEPESGVSLPKETDDSTCRYNEARLIFQRLCTIGCGDSSIPPLDKVVANAPLHSGLTEESKMVETFLRDEVDTNGVSSMFNEWPEAGEADSYCWDYSGLDWDCSVLDVLGSLYSDTKGLQKKRPQETPTKRPQNAHKKRPQNTHKKRPQKIGQKTAHFENWQIPSKY